MEAYALPRGYKAVVHSLQGGYEVVLYNEENDVVSTTHHTRVAFRELRDAMETRHRTTVARGRLRLPMYNHGRERA